ncbi:hypothetical protein Q5530_06745 [Saccharothrix sp. BKS2]|uniref:Beta-ketoacyl synthase-like protein n=1 Tax=Saccharothrix lopnurensis TaxID=1670621 RepID=A0ABW1P5W7_9PSEU
MSAEPTVRVAVRGTGLRLPGVSCPEIRWPVNHDRESSLAVSAASAAAFRAKSGRGAPVVGRVGTVWATPGARVASEVSRRLHLTGPYLDLVGTRDAGAQAFVEAAHMVQQGWADQVVVGASAGPDRDGAVSAVLDNRPVAGDLVVRPVGRTQLGEPDDLLAECLDRLGGPADAVVLSASGGVEEFRAAVRRRGLPFRHVEQQFGDFGAVGGLVAAVSPATVRTRQHALTLVVTVGETGNAVAVEVTTWNGDPRWT